jgi:hypothetical protein
MRRREPSICGRRRGGAHVFVSYAHADCGRWRRGLFNAVDAPQVMADVVHRHPAGVKGDDHFPRPPVRVSCMGSSAGENVLARSHSTSTRTGPNSVCTVSGRRAVSGVARPDRAWRNPDARSAQRPTRLVQHGPRYSPVSAANGDGQYADAAQSIARHWTGLRG